MSDKDWKRQQAEEADRAAMREELRKQAEHDESARRELERQNQQRQGILDNYDKKDFND